MHQDFTRMHIKFKYIDCFFKILQSNAKLGYVIKVRRNNLCIKYSHWITLRPTTDTERSSEKCHVIKKIRDLFYSHH